MNENVISPLVDFSTLRAYSKGKPIADDGFALQHQFLMLEKIYKNHLLPPIENDSAKSVPTAANSVNLCIHLMKDLLC